MSPTVRSPGAFFASAALHAVLMAFVLWFAWSKRQSKEDVPQIFELVAGEGDNFAATEAPALGVEGGGLKLEIPLPPVPDPSPVTEPAPPEPEPSPVVPAAAPVEVAPPPPKPAPAEYKPVNMAKMVDRIADKRAANIEKKVKAEQKAADARVAKEAAANAKKMTKAEFDRLNQGKSSPSQKATGGGGTGAVKRIDAEGISKGVVGGSTANKTAGAGGKALTRQEEIGLSDAYISLLIQKLKAAHQKPEGLSDLLEATVKFSLLSSGSIVNVTVISSSRNSEFDQSVMAAFRRISLPPPPANLKTSDYTITFKMREDV